MPTPASQKSSLSLDAWALILAIALAAVVRIGLLKAVPW